MTQKNYKTQEWEMVVGNMRHIHANICIFAKEASLTLILSNILNKNFSLPNEIKSKYSNQ